MSKRGRSEDDDIKNAIFAFEEAKQTLNAKLKEWVENNPTCYVVVESNQGYNDIYVKSYHITREDAEKAKPENLRSGWEPTTYFVDQRKTKDIHIEKIKEMFKF